MILSEFFGSYPGLYLTQSFLHALVASAIVEIAIKVWNVRNPAARQRLLLFVITYPIFSFPMYQLANPDRDSVYFRMGALFDSGRWLNFELLSVLPVSIILVLVFSITSLVFFAQELLPIVRHALETRNPGIEGVPPPKDSTVYKALEQMPGEKPETYLLDDEDPIIFSSTGKHGSIYLSSALLEVLTIEELQAALAHEIAHVMRSRRPLLLVTFFFRAVMFFNPIVLMAFRRAIQEDEKICDEAAVSMTRKPLALAETLKKLYMTPETSGPQKTLKGADYMGMLEEYSHRLNIESRISRLEKGYGASPDGKWMVFAFTLIVVIVFNYFVV